MTVRFPNLTIELALGVDPATAPATWTWTDVTEFVNVEPRLHIRRGRGPEADTSDPSMLTMSVHNRDGRWLPENPLSPWYGLISEGTPVRVRYDGLERFAGFISELPVSWPGGGIDTEAQVVANGPIRRAGRFGSQRKSALRRRNLRLPGLVEYWPLEEQSDAFQAASALAGGLPSQVEARAAFLADPDAPPPRFGMSGGPAGTDRSVEIADRNNVLTLRPAGPVGDGWTAQWWATLQQVDDPEDVGVFAEMVTSVGGSEPVVTAVQWATVTGQPDNQLSLVALDGTGIFDDVTTVVINDSPALFTITVSADGSNIKLRMDQPELGTSYNLEVDGLDGPFKHERLTMWRIGCLGRWVVSHVTVGVGDWLAEADGTAEAGLAHRGEAAGRRIERLADEEGVASDVSAPDESMRLGRQRSATAVELWREAEQADFGLLTESAHGVRFRPVADLYNQPVALTLSAPEKVQADRDDRSLANDVTASRVGGSWSRRSDQGHIDRFGRYEIDVTVSVDTDRLLDDVAGWRLHLGTGERMRFSQVGFALHHQPSLLADWLAVEPGDRLAIEGLAHLAGLAGRDPLQLLMFGWDEYITSMTWDVVLSCMPAELWTVWEIGPDDPAQSPPDAPSRLDTAGSELGSAVDASTASLSVVTTVGPLWTVDTDDMPFDIRVGGEVMRVTAVSGATSPQTFTVSRGVNGVTVAHDAGVPVRLAIPARLGL